MTANCIDSYITIVQNFSRLNNYGNLASMVSKEIANLSRYPADLDAALALLDPQRHSIGILGLLLAKFSTSPPSDFEPLMMSCDEFFSICHGEHVRYATDSYAELCHKLTLLLVERKQAIRGISILTKAILKIQLNEAQLTSIHADLCQLCLLAKCFKPALQFLDVNITEISKENGKFESKHLLLYYYYGGMIYTALKKFQRAAFFYEIAVTTPSMVVSHIMLEAYKKYILVSLIEFGKVQVLPKYTSPVVSRYIKQLSQSYIELLNAFNSPSSNLAAIITKHQDVFIRDHNMGLVNQVKKAYYRKNIKCLTKTFMTLSLADMTNRVKLGSAAEAQKYVLNMIEDGDIFATINERDGMVSFLDNPEKYDNLDTLIRLQNQMAEYIKLEKKVAEMEYEIAISPQYLQKISNYSEDESTGTALK